MHRLSLLLLLTACPGNDDKQQESASPVDTDDDDDVLVFEAPELDDDGDGSPNSRDCADTNPDIYPGAAETCDGLDQDCDGAIDDDAVDATAFYLDDDEDGFGGDVILAACTQPEGTQTTSADCDDDDDEVYPGAPEICDDDVVNDCDGDADLAREGCTPGGTEEVRLIGLPFLGLSVGADVGTAVSMGGDVNGDGKDDLLIGAPAAEGPDGVTGGAFLLHGPLSTNHVEYEVDASIYGEEVGEGAGTGLALGDDMDGDRYGELLVGSTGVSTWGANSGGAALFYGPVGGPHPLAHGDALFVSGGAGTRLGASASLGGDTDGDGIHDLLLGSDEQDTADEGAAWLFLGPLSGVLVPGTADAQLKGTAADDRAGRTVSTRGDANGDGLADMVVGGPASAGEGDALGVVWLALAPLSGTLVLSDADASFYGPGPEGDAGLSLGFGGDMDGDGLSDLAVGSPGYGTEGSAQGAAWLVSAPASFGHQSLEAATASALGAEGGDHLGHGISLEGDTDGDGRADLVIGVPRADDGATHGEVLIWYGPASGALSADEADYTLLGRSEGDRMGYAVSSEGDTDQDGLADLLLGAIGDTGAGTTAGSAWQVFSLGY